MLKNNVSLKGKSLLLNTIFITINIIGLLFLVLGYHPTFESQALLFKILGYGLMAISLVFLFILKGWILFSYVVRIIIGGVFIVSGVIKANDPKGFSYKLEEYFQDGALAYRIKDWFHWDTFTLEYFIQYALLISIIICILEILLGVLILLGVKIKAVTWLTLLMLLFFTFLTWHTKECDPNATFKDVDTYAKTSSIAQIKISQASQNDKITILKETPSKVTIQEIKSTQCVSDCGCFGDALKGSVGRSLTPQESFWKDIILLYLTVILFIPRRKIKINSRKENILMIVGGMVVISIFSSIFSWFFPVIFGLLTFLLALWIKKTGGKLLGNQLGMILAILFTTGLFITYVLMYLPLKDYRPYHVGANLIEEMNSGVPGQYENIMVYTNKNTKKDTTIKVFDESTKAIWGDTKNWEFTERKTITIVPQILPSIQQFNPTIDVGALTSTEEGFPYISKIIKGNQVPYVNLIEKSSGNLYPMLLSDFQLAEIDTSLYTIGDTITRLSDSITDISLKDYILQQKQIILLFSRRLEKGDWSRKARLKEIHQKAQKNGIPMLLISTASRKRVMEFREKTGLYIPTIQNDAIEIKAITRSNPTMMIIKDGIVKGKYPYRSTPSWEWLIENSIQIKK